jgi:hypothetical protein
MVLVGNYLLYIYLLTKSVGGLMNYIGFGLGILYALFIFIIITWIIRYVAYHVGKQIGFYDLFKKIYTSLKRR